MAKKFMIDTRIFKTRKEAKKTAKFFQDVMGRETRIAKTKGKKEYFIKLR
jgi:hypothetical protein